MRCYKYQTLKIAIRSSDRIKLNHGYVVINTMRKAKLKLVKVDAQRGEQYSDSDCVTADSEQQYVELLFGKYRNALAQYLVKLLRNEADAAELLQETYLRLLEQASLDHLEANARAYLFRVATNLVRDKARREKVRARDQHDPAEEIELPSDRPGPSKMAEWDQTLGKVKRAVLGLKPQCRQIFVMSRFKGMSYPEIAKVLGTTTRTVERNMSMAIAHVKAEIGEN